MAANDLSKQFAKVAKTGSGKITPSTSFKWPSTSKRTLIRSYTTRKSTKSGIVVQRSGAFNFKKSRMG